MSLHRLACHPGTPSTAIERIEVKLECAASDIRLSYRMIGHAERVVAVPPVPGAPRRRRDELWRTTCCELFLRDAIGAGYCEYNFAPCGDWAAYRFNGYRSGRAALETRAPRIALERSPGVLALIVRLTDLPLESRTEAQRIGLACVVETDTPRHESPMRDGARDAEHSYWALAHPSGQPDFHHAGAFASIHLDQAADSIAHG